MPLITSDVKPNHLDEGEYNIEGFEFNVLHTPGHSPGSLTYVFEDFAVVGDTLFNNGIGRTDYIAVIMKHWLILLKINYLN